MSWPTTPGPFHSNRYLHLSRTKAGLQRCNGLICSPTTLGCFLPSPFLSPLCVVTSPVQPTMKRYSGFATESRNPKVWAHTGTACSQDTLPFCCALATVSTSGFSTHSFFFLQTLWSLIHVDTCGTLLMPSAHIQNS